MTFLDQQNAMMIDPVDISLANMTTNVPASALLAYNAATTYGMGVEIIDTTTRIVYRSVQAGNVGHDPLTSPTWWQARGVENRLLMVDESIGSQTTNADAIDVSITPGVNATALVLFNVDATEVQVMRSNPDGGAPYDKTYPMLRPSGNSWWNWFFTPIEREDRLLVMDLPAYYNAVTRVIIKKPGGTTKVGELVLGTIRRLGNTQWGASVSITDFSSKKRDAYGGWVVVAGAYSELLKLRLMVEGPMYDRIVQQLAPYRAKPVVWVGSPTLKSLLAYGYFTSLDNVLTNNGISDCNLVIEGLLVS